MLVVVLEAVLTFDGNVLQLLQNMFSMQGTGELGLPYIVLPIGISFFTFQALLFPRLMHCYLSQHPWNHLPRLRHLQNHFLRLRHLQNHFLPLSHLRNYFHRLY